MDYVSSMTIENPHVTISGINPSSGSTLNGLERTRLLRAMRARIGDVQSGEEFGKLALARESELGGKVQGKRNLFEQFDEDLKV